MLVIMILLLVTAWMYKVRHQNAKSKTAELIDKMNAELKTQDPESDTHAVLEKILGDDAQ